MRLRKGWTQEQVSARLGIARQTLTRWEQGERFASTEQTQALFYVLEAEEEEIVALTAGAFAEAPAVKHRNWEEARESLRKRLHSVNFFMQELQDLHYLMLEREVWDWAASDAEARTELAHIYAYHSSFAHNHARWQEAIPLAQKARTLLSHQPPDAEYVRAILTLASGTVYGGHQLTPERGIQLLKPLMYWNGSPEYRAWILADIARYASLSGKLEAALAPSEQAQRVAERCGNPSEPYLRRIDHARILLEAGRYGEALSRLPDPVGRSPGERVTLLLVQAEAHVLQGDHSEGQDCLQQAQDLVEAHAIAHLRPRVAILRAKF
jgi:transcriptional regulator with XRE-family HTH domain